MIKITISVIVLIIVISGFKILDRSSSHDFVIVDITAQATLGGPSHPDSLGGHGIMWSDVNNNGYPDVYITMNWKYNIYYPELFYLNNGQYKFTESAKRLGIADIDGGSHGAVFADLDNDGDYDLVNGSTLSYDGGPINNNIYENTNSSFIERTPASMKQIRENTRGVASFDIKKDGLLDIIFISGWEGTNDRPGEKNEVYINKGGYNFIKDTLYVVENVPAAQGVIDTDFDGDGDIDIISCNKGGKLVILRNENNNLRFTLLDPGEVGIKHTAYSGISSGDIDNDGDLDLILINQESGDFNEAYLYLNNKNGFTHTHTFTKIDGYTAGFADLNLDTFLDIVFDGHPSVYLNNGDGTFRKGPEIPLNNIDDPRSVAFADIDKDGDLDFAFAVKRNINRLYRNDYSGNNSWLKIKLTAPNGQAGAFGAKVYLYDMNDQLIVLREAKSSYGYLAQDDQIIHFGTGEHEKVNIKVVFITGEVSELKGVNTNSMVTIE